MSAAEQRCVTFEWNQTTDTSVPFESTAYELIEQRLMAIEYDALVFEGETMSASEFDVHTRTLAYELSTQASVQLSGTVGLCLERSEKELVGIVGIWRAGGAHIPLDPNCWPLNRRTNILEDCGCNIVVLADESSAKQLFPSVSSRLKLICLETLYMRPSASRLHLDVLDQQWERFVRSRTHSW